MIILEKPYVSPFLLKTLEEKQIPVLLNETSVAFKEQYQLNYQTEKDVVDDVKDNKHRYIYTNSENAIQWINDNLDFSPLPNWIHKFKDKVTFRELIKPLYEDYFYQAIRMHELKSFDPYSISYPVVFKPSVGFFSMGVYKLHSPADWKGVMNALDAELEEKGHLYPEAVFDSSKFIIESLIEGREFAIDAYFDDHGKAVVLNIMEHFFSSDSDVSDRLYSTSAELFMVFLEPFRDLLNNLGRLLRIKRFPVHLEVRVTPQGDIIPIEGNPLRFGGWCTTADMAGMSFGHNPYTFFFEQKKPNWEQVLPQNLGKQFHILILDNSTGLKATEIEAFDHQALEAKFDKVLKYRPVDHKEYPLFGFLFVETGADTSAVQEILRSDLSDFLILKK